MAAAEGWNPGLHDGETFFATDPDGFLSVELDDTFIGGGAIVRHSDTFGFMGLFLMAPEYRGQGIGRKLWYARRDLLLDRLGENAAIGMDGVSAMVGFYQAGGFVPQYVSSRFEARSTFGPDAADPDVTAIETQDLPSLEELDRRAFPSQRPAYLAAWLAQPDAHRLGYRHRDGRLLGYGVIRPCREGWKVGPLFAETTEVANSLLVALMAKAYGETVAIDVPSVNPQAESLCRSLGMETKFECTRMYFGPKPTYDASLIYGLTSFELG